MGASHADQLIVCAGDSISDNTFLVGFAWPTQLGQFMPGSTVFPGGVAGATTSDLMQRVSDLGVLWKSWSDINNQSLWTFYGGKRCYVLCGINDIVFTTRTAAQIWSNLQFICSDLQQFGFSPYLLTITPAGGSAGWTAGQETIRTGVNASILAGPYPSVNLEALGTGANPNVLQAVYDNGGGIHPNVLGSRQLACMVAAQSGSSFTPPGITITESGVIQPVIDPGSGVRTIPGVAQGHWGIAVSDGSPYHDTQGAVAAEKATFAVDQAGNPILVQ